MKIIYQNTDPLHGILRTAFVMMLANLLSFGGVAAESPAVVIVHGAWGGAHHWKPVSESLREHHQGDLRRASLTGLGERSHLASPQVDLNTHIRDVVNLIEFDDLRSVVLIGHSYGGVVISGVAETIPERISKLVYLDAHLLEDGEFYFSHHPERQAKLTARANEDGQGYLIPVDWKNDVRDTPHPLKAMTTPLSRDNPVAQKIPGVYWLFADGGEAKDDMRLRYLQRAQERGYQTRIFSWGHNPQRQRPAELATQLLTVIQNEVVVKKSTRAPGSANSVPAENSAEQIP